MNIADILLPRRIRDALDARPRSSEEESERTDYLRSIRPTSFLTAAGFSILGIARIIIGLNDWADYAMLPLFLVLAASNAYTFTRVGQILKR